MAWPKLRLTVLRCEKDCGENTARHNHSKQYPMDIIASLSDVMRGGPRSRPRRIMRVIVILGSGFIRRTLETSWCGEV